MAEKFKVDTARHIANGLAKAFISLNMAPKGYYTALGH